MLVAQLESMNSAGKHHSNLLELEGVPVLIHIFRTGSGLGKMHSERILALMTRHRKWQVESIDNLGKSLKLMQTILKDPELLGLVNLYDGFTNRMW